MQRLSLNRNFLFAICVLAMSLASGYALAVDRPLFREGAVWVFRILQDHQTSFGKNHLRYLSALVELPAVLVAWAAGASEVTVLVTKVWEASFLLLPPLGLIAAWFLLRRYRLREGASLLLLGFATGTMPATAYAWDQMVEVLALFWPLFILVSRSSFRSTRSRAALGVGMLFMAISHESALLAFLAFAAVAATRTGRTRAALLLVSLLGALSTLLRIHYGDYVTAGAYVSGLAEAPSLLLVPSLVLVL